uniref:G-patch domain-containing protein n=1 Tax=Cannabis sativa TaxID=3483 RepID=A0A803Q5L1_CANSA
MILFWLGGTMIKDSEAYSSGSSGAIDPSNIGFKLLKKHGWKEGTGLGISEQGRLEPVEACLKNNKRGLGADKGKKKVLKPHDAKDATNSHRSALKKVEVTLQKDEEDAGI